MRPALVRFALAALMLLLAAGPALAHVHVLHADAGQHTEAGHADDCPLCTTGSAILAALCPVSAGAPAPECALRLHPELAAVLPLPAPGSPGSPRAPPISPAL